MKKIAMKGKDNACIDANYYCGDKNTVKGIVIVCHGFGEHSDSYKELTEYLEQENYASIVFNQRGHGNLSFKKLGVIPNYQTFLNDIKSVVYYAKNEMPNTPIALFGHSMGGNIALNYLLKHGQSEFKCAILEAPWLALYGRELSPIEAKMSKAISYIIPNFEMPKFFSKLPIPVHKLSSDKAKQEEIENDQLYHNRMTWRLVAGVNDGCTYVLKNTQQLSIPMFLAEAIFEEVVDNAISSKAIAKLYDTCTRSVIVSYESKHAIHKDKERERFFRDVVGFLDEYMR